MEFTAGMLLLEFTMATRNETESENDIVMGTGMWRYRPTVPPSIVAGGRK